MWNGKLSTLWWVLGSEWTSWAPDVAAIADSSRPGLLGTSQLEDLQPLLSSQSSVDTSGPNAAKLSASVDIDYLGNVV